MECNNMLRAAYLIGCLCWFCCYYYLAVGHGRIAWDADALLQHVRDDLKNSTRDSVTLGPEFSFWQEIKKFHEDVLVTHVDIYKIWDNASSGKCYRSYLEIKLLLKFL